jgi:hypothetical protein
MDAWRESTAVIPHMRGLVRERKEPSGAVGAGK